MHPEADDADLEAIVFGRGPEFVDDAEPSEAEAEVAASAEEAPTEKLGKSAKRKRKKLSSEVAATPATVWFDPDDAKLKVDLRARNMTKKLQRTDEETKVSGVEYEQRLREQFHKLHGNATWAEKKEVPAANAWSDEEDETIEQPASSAKLTGVADAAGGPLRPTELSMTRLSDIPISPGCKLGAAVVQALQFHPNSELLLAAGLDKRLQLFGVDGDENAKVSSYHIKNFPIQEASFTPDGSQILVTGLGNKMWALDVPTSTWLAVDCNLSPQAQSRLYGLTVGPNAVDSPGLRSSQMYVTLGQSGSVLVCDVQSKLPIRTFRMSTNGVSAAFSPNSDSLWTADQEGGLYEWDLGTGRCRQKARDPWATKVRCIAMSRVTAFAPTPMLAVGTDSGNVDFFDTSGSQLPKEPTRSFANIRTRVTGLTFHKDGELFAATSKWTDDCLKMVHMGTGTTYQNWPTSRTPLNKVSAIEFSRHNGLMAIGNERGRVLLYRLSHYEKASAS